MPISPDQRAELLALYKELRLADVRDGLDSVMRHFSGSMDADVRPVWRTRAYGIARTVRYLPYEGPPINIPQEEYLDWASRYYAEICSYPWMEDIQAGDFIVIDQSGQDVGLMGSNNTLAGVKAGAAGYVIDGGIRDTDEVILQKVPVWSRTIAKCMPQLRLRYDAKDIPVEVGGVLVHPGDLVVADGDGVVVVPQAQARAVAKYAAEERGRDMEARRKLYAALELPLDGSFVSLGK